MKKTIMLTMVVIGVVLAAFPVSRAGNSQRFPDVCFGKGKYFVAWHDTRSGDTKDIYGARVTTSGSIVDIGGIAISAAPHGQQQVVVGYGDDKYFAIWSDFRSNTNFNIYGARIGAVNGDVMDPNGFRGNEVNWDQIAPDGCFGEERFLVVFADNRDGEYGIYGARVSTDGVILDPGGEIISEGDHGKGSPRVAFAWGPEGDKNLLVVWHDYENGNDWDIYGAIIDRDLNVIKTFPICTAADDQRAPDVAFDGTNYLVTWQDKRSGNWNINGARISQTGEVLDSAGVRQQNVDWDQLRPRIAFDGTNYLVVFQNFKDDVPGIYACRIDKEDGQLLDVQGKKIVLSSDTAANPSVSFDGSNYLVVWEQWTDGKKENADIWAALVDKDVNDLGIVERTPASELTFDVFQISTSVVRFSITSSEFVKVTIYDITGKPVNTIDFGGSRTVLWTAVDFNGNFLPPGIYLAKAVSGNNSITKSIVIIK